MDTRHAITFWRKNDAFVTELADYLQGKRVLEVFAGNGFLAKELQDRHVNIRPTTLFASHDGHEYGMYADVEELEASAAVNRYEEESDVLLMCWPTATEGAYRALLAWGPDKPVIYIGEAPRPELPGIAGLSGCASDAFFEVIRWEKDFSRYQGNMLERAGVIRLDPELMLQSSTSINKNTYNRGKFDEQSDHQECR